MDLKNIETLQLLQSVMENSSNLYLIKDIDSSILLANTTAAKYLGYGSAEELMGKNIKAENYPCDTRELSSLFYQEDQEVLLNKTQSSFIFYTRFADNNWHMMYGTKTPVLDKDAKPIGIIDNYMDITNNPFFNFSHLLLNEQVVTTTQKLKRQFTYKLTDTIEELDITDRQLECLYFLLSGKNSAEIAETLQLSKRTIETHMENLKKKLNCKTKTSLIEFALHKGLLNYVPRKLLVE